jgi:hypothetical protein
MGMSAPAAAEIRTIRFDIDDTRRGGYSWGWRGRPFYLSMDPHLTGVSRGDAA